MQNVERHPGNLDSLDALSGFVSSSPNGVKLKMLILGIDCVAPAKSQVEVYMRTPGTSLSHVISILTLDNNINLVPETRAEIREIWRATLGLDEDFSDDAELRPCAHETSGILFYFDIRPRSQLPEVKCYVPVRHYARNDAAVASGLIEFLEKVGRAGSAGTTKRYLAMLRGFSGPQEIESTKGLHTCISFGVQKSGELQLTSYLSPQVYKRLANAKNGQMAQWLCLKQHLVTEMSVTRAVILVFYLDIDSIIL